MGDSFEESGMFDASLSMWKGIKQNKDGSFSYEDDDFEPISLDVYTAASLGEDDIVQDILDRKDIRLNAKNAGGWTALMYASYMGHNSTVQILLDAGADANFKNHLSYSSLILAAMCGNESTMAVLIQKGGDVEAKDKRGWTALFHAASSGHQQTTEFLLKVGANYEIVEPSQGLTPLMEAAASGHELIVQLLLQKGADVTRQDFQGEMASNLALAYGHTKIAGLIDQYKTRKPKPPACLAQRKGHNTEDRSSGNNCGHSGPSIHAGPKAFAQMTGLGSDGKPHPHANVPAFLQDQLSHITVAEPAQWDGPKDLESLLSEIDCSKHYHIFKEQDIDLQIFLTLTDADLKEIGIELFGPRRKMESAIGRLTSEIRTKMTDRPEASYADAINSKLQVAQTKLKQINETKDTLEAQVAQERELRKVTEGVLIGQKEIWISLKRLTDKLAPTHAKLGQNLNQIRSHLQQSETVSTVNRNSGRDVQDTGSLMREIDKLYSYTRDSMSEMQKVLQRAKSSSGAG